MVVPCRLTTTTQTTIETENNHGYRVSSALERERVFDGHYHGPA